jgi:hypothetical protein
MAEDWERDCTVPEASTPLCKERISRNLNLGLDASPCPERVAI